jgi:uncharacterized protein involved in exopolysaccharide biosynthesis
MTIPADHHNTGSPAALRIAYQAVRRNFKAILIAAVATAAVTLLVNLLLPATYRVAATLLPEAPRAALPGFDQISEVAQLAGMKVPGNEVSRLYPDILLSESILLPVIERRYRSVRFNDSLDLTVYFELDEETREENLAEALILLRRKMSASYEAKTGIVRIALEMPEPGLAADVLNAAIRELDLFMRVKQVSSASEQRKWIETRLRDVELDLRRAEEALKLFREKNRRIIDSPQLLLDQERMLRDIEMKSTVFIELKKQAELARIEEIKNIAIVNVLDPARPPVERSGPQRTVNTLAAFLLTLLGGVVFVSMVARYGGRARQLFSADRTA